MEDRIQAYLESQRGEVEKVLTQLCCFPSTYGHEREAQEYIFDYCQDIGLDIERQFIPQELKQDPQYTAHVEDLPYGRDRYNLVGARQGTKAGRSIVLNSHVDVVPAEAAWKDAFNATCHQGVIRGRGACDAKGNVVTIILAVRALDALDISLEGDVLYQFVIDEEIGGNGALAAIRQGHVADAALVLEPTSLRAHPANKGALWFRVDVEGRSVHMGRIGDGVSALEHAVEVMDIFRQYERHMIDQYGDHPLFVGVERPIQMNFGIMRSGDFPSTVPGYAVLEGGVGFLPNQPIREVVADLKSWIEERGSPWLRDHFAIGHQRLHNDAYADDVNDPFVQATAAALRANGLNDELKGWIASCDARLFHHVAGIPAVTFGVGSMTYAHSSQEQITTDEILKGASVILSLLMDWNNRPRREVSHGA